MGTRSLTCVTLDGEYRIAQYGQWDGYPEGQGSTVLKFCAEVLSKPKESERFIEHLKTTCWITRQELSSLWSLVGVDPESPRVSMKSAVQFKERWPYLHIDCGAGILDHVHRESGLKLTNNLTCAADSLLCEWAYLLNLDTMHLEVYRGFNEEPLSPDERFASLPTGEDAKGYYPIKMVAKWPVRMLPDLEDFVVTLERLAERERRPDSSAAHE